jgi:hypothetical protein
MQVPESGGTPTVLTKVDASLGEFSHTAPQLLPSGRLLYLAENAKSENSAIYAAPLSDSSKRVLVTRSPGPALYAPSGNGRDYLLTVSEQGLVAREFDIRNLTLGAPRTLVSQVRSWLPGAVSPGGILLYAGGPNASRFMWLDRAGKNLEVLSEPDNYQAFRLSPDGKRFIAVRAGASLRNSDLWLMAVERRSASSPRPSLIKPRFGQTMAEPCFSPTRFPLKDAVSSVKVSRIRGKGSVLGNCGPRDCVTGRATGDTFSSSTAIRKPGGTSGWPQ